MSAVCVAYDPASN